MWLKPSGSSSHFGSSHFRSSISLQASSMLLLALAHGLRYPCDIPPSVEVKVSSSSCRVC